MRVGVFHWRLVSKSALPACALVALAVLRLLVGDAEVHRASGDWAAGLVTLLCRSYPVDLSGLGMPVEVWSAVVVRSTHPVVLK